LGRRIARRKVRPAFRRAFKGRRSWSNYLELESQLEHKLKMSKTMKILKSKKFAKLPSKWNSISFLFLLQKYATPKVVSIYYGRSWVEESPVTLKV